ncbi:hypothetical protein BU26DRAFT_560309 [Trematosphaeria pertusa]|uniref:Uncharacterized protein n=1 Tax=Trematosphaeria pertusa TaxID=390896 RepID=A0A6A6IUV1_9PLEO|nr:uncharacterized protein BU26DRAFT_560309 [Trematosphaeria pertusa]KAF2252963.1 hypothetical protein BU26DRAFT_560309 [Trematosphaeria pertusa]
MSADEKLAELEAQIKENAERIQGLNTELRVYNQETEQFIALLRDQEGIQISSLDHQDAEASLREEYHDGGEGVFEDIDLRTPQSYHRPQAQGMLPGAHHAGPSPPERSTDWNSAAARAAALCLALVIPGASGELLEFPIEMHDLAFVLQETLKRKGWRKDCISIAIEGFLERPMIRIMHERG